MRETADKFRSNEEEGPHIEEDLENAPADEDYDSDVYIFHYEDKALE